MLRDFQISELRTLLNSATPSILRKSFISGPCTCDRTLSVIHDHKWEWGQKLFWKFESFAFIDNSRFMTTE